MLAAERVVWLSTVRPDGLPHLVPTWFLWDGDALLVYSKPDAVKVRNLRANPRLMVALGRPEHDFAVGLIEATAELEPHDDGVPDAFFAKYAADLAAAGLERAAFCATYTQTVRILPTRFLAWRGRGPWHAGQPGSGATAGPSAAPRAAAIARRTAKLLDRAANRLRVIALDPAAQG